MEFETLKLVLLLARLDGVPRVELHPLIIDAADSASHLAHSTRYPRLLFPCLFAERAEAALELERIRFQNYWGKLDELAPLETFITSARSVQPASNRNSLTKR
jgi:hypothetical protein